MGPGPWVGELSELVVPGSDVVVPGCQLVPGCVTVVAASVVSSWIVVVCFVVSVAGADVEGGLHCLQSSFVISLNPDL